MQGDLGRVAGLLKLWLVTNNGKGGVPNDINQMMISFRELQKQIFEKSIYFMIAKRVERKKNNIKYGTIGSLHHGFRWWCFAKRLETYV